MKIFGIDFTSRPSRRKPITCVEGVMDGDVLRARSLARWHDYVPFEATLVQPGPWVAGLDFPFGQARRFLETIGWPPAWADYVAHAAALGRADFREALTDYRLPRAPGDKEHRRATDAAAGSISPQKLHGVPVGLMFFEGAPRLLASGACIPSLHHGDIERIAVEAYPGLIARALVGRRSYKNDDPRRQTAEQLERRRAIVTQLREHAPRLYGFAVETDLDLCTDPGADDLDALLCAVQAAWAWTRRDQRYGAPDDADPLEGWITNPHAAGRLG